MEGHGAPTWRIIPFGKWLITMVTLSPLNGVVGPLPNGRNLWLINRGDPNHLQVMGWSSKYKRPYGKMGWESPGTKVFPYEKIPCLRGWQVVSVVTPARSGHPDVELVEPNGVVPFGFFFSLKSNILESLLYHFFRQLWLVLGVKLMEINSNWFSRYGCFPKIGMPQNGWFISWKTLLK